MAEGRTTREEFLRMVREALGKGTDAPAPSYPRLGESLQGLTQRAKEVVRRCEAKRGELLGLLEQKASTIGWKVFRAPSLEDAAGYLREVANKHKAQRVVRSDQAVFQRLDLAKVLPGAQVTVMAQGVGATRQALRTEAARADLGVTGVDYAVAETGSIVLLPRKGLSRLVSLLPPVHIAIVEPEQVIQSLDDLFLLRRVAFLQNGGDMGSYMNIITGPSRSADIEQTVVVGVHGPVEAHMVIVDKA